MERAGDILKKFLEKRGLSIGGKYTSFFKGWYTIVDRNIAEHSRVIDIINNDLLVEVDHPGFAQLIDLKKNEILLRLSKRYRDIDIRGIKTRVKE